MKIDVKKTLARGAVGLVVLVLAAALVFLGWRTAARWNVARDRAFETPPGIELLEKVRIGGIDQWINVRGRDTANPVLLYAHGGPGFPMMPFAHLFQTPWEKFFTVVQWDQRGTGKTYLANDPESVAATMSMDRMIEDARELTEYLRKRFGKEKIFFLGHSWGTMFGIPLVRKYPELFHAYIGTGQVISTKDNESVGYQRALEVARERKITEAIAELEAIAPYPHPQNGTKDTRHILRKWQREFGFSVYQKTDFEMTKMMLFAGLRSPEYSLMELKSVLSFEGSQMSRTALADEIDALDANTLGYDWPVPVIFLLGRHDWQVPSVIAAEYFDKINAPHKKLVWFERSAHSPPSEQPEEFFRALVDEVLPLATMAADQSAAESTDQP